MRNNTSWLQHIPKHWEVKRMKDIFLESDEITETGKEDLLSVSEYYGVARRKDKMTEDEVYETRADSLIGYKVCHRGDLVSNIMLTWKRALGISNYDGIVSPAYAVYKGLGINSGYYHYLLRSDMYIAEFKRQSKGIIESRLRLYTDRFYNIPAIYPPLSEQEKIAHYLDKKVGDIDQKVSLIEKKIERYQLLKKSIINEVVTKGLHPEAPLKDSQISWLGQIPAHWEVKRLKDLHSGANVGESIDKEYWSSNSFDKIFYTAGETFIYSTYENFPKYKLVGKDDLLLSRNGTPYVYLPKLNALYTDHIIRIRLKTELCDKRYVRYCLQRSIEFEKVDVVMLATWSMSIWNEQKISLPPLSEQQEIASYLDQKCADIDAIIANCTAQIEKYKTLKRALINEVVTGQRAIE